MIREMLCFHSKHATFGSHPQTLEFPPKKWSHNLCWLYTSEREKRREQQTHYFPQIPRKEKEKNWPTQPSTFQPTRQLRNVKFIPTLCWKLWRAERAKIDPQFHSLSPRQLAPIIFRAMFEEREEGITFFLSSGKGNVVAFELLRPVKLSCDGKKRQNGNSFSSFHVDVWWWRQQYKHN